jgi:enoyl-CoA hydratase
LGQTIVKAAGSHMHYSVSEGLGLVQLDHPPTRNSLTDEGVETLIKLAEAAAEDADIYGLLIIGADDGSFSSGADVDMIPDLCDMDPDAIRRRLARWQRALLSLERLEKPVVAAINGTCVGGGAELSLACDIRIACEQASFGFPEAKLGLAPDMGSSHRLGRIVGLGWAKHLILTGDFIDSRTAERIGLVSAVYPNENFNEAAESFVRESLLTRAPLAQGLAKRLLDRNFGRSIEEALEAELWVQAGLYKGEEVTEGYRAFKQKRAAKFR